MFQTRIVWNWTVRIRSKWSEDWQMAFNVDKGSVIHFGFNNNGFDLTLGGRLLEVHESEKDLDFIIKDNYMRKITTFREKIMFIKQNKVSSLKELAEVADIFDKSCTGTSYEWHEPQQGSRFNNGKTPDTNRELGNRYFGKTFDLEEARHRNWGVDNTNQNNRK